MSFHDVEQNSEHWFQLRTGKLTFSNLGMVMANYPKAFGEPAKKLAVDIALERITGAPMENGYTNEHMERGHVQEIEARKLYEQQTFTDVANGGFFDLGDTGFSPDGLVGDDGMIEIKSAIPSIHFSRIKRQGLDPAHKWQCLGNLQGAERKWLDFISYCPAFPEDKRLYIYRVYPENYIDSFARIDERVSEFMAMIDENIKVISDSKYTIN